MSYQAYLLLFAGSFFRSNKVLLQRFELKLLTKLKSDVPPKSRRFLARKIFYFFTEQYSLSKYVSASVFAD